MEEEKICGSCSGRGYYPQKDITGDFFKAANALLESTMPSQWDRLGRVLREEAKTIREIGARLCHACQGRGSIIRQEPRPVGRPRKTQYDRVVEAIKRAGERGILIGEIKGPFEIDHKERENAIYNLQKEGKIVWEVDKKHGDVRVWSIEGGYERCT